MCGTTETRTQLPLASTADHGCSCCAPAAETQATPAGTSEAQASGTQYALEGLTCGHCVQTVEKAVSRVPGVQTAAVDLVPGGTSRLSVTGTADQDALTEAVRSSGYALTGTK